jgi:hypothetical protein
MTLTLVISSICPILFLQVLMLMKKQVLEETVYKILLKLSLSLLLTRLGYTTMLGLTSRWIPAPDPMMISAQRQASDPTHILFQRRLLALLCSGLQQELWDLLRLSIQRRRLRHRVLDQVRLLQDLLCRVIVQHLMLKIKLLHNKPLLLRLLHDCSMVFQGQSVSLMALFIGAYLVQWRTEGFVGCNA